MDLRGIIFELQTEKERLDQAIGALERLAKTKIHKRAVEEAPDPSSETQDDTAGQEESFSSS